MEKVIKLVTQSFTSGQTQRHGILSSHAKNAKVRNKTGLYFKIKCTATAWSTQPKLINTKFFLKMVFNCDVRNNFVYIGILNGYNQYSFFSHLKLTQSTLVCNIETINSTLT